MNCFGSVAPKFSHSHKATQAKADRYKYQAQQHCSNGNPTTDLTRYTHTLCMGTKLPQQSELLWYVVGFHATRPTLRGSFDKIPNYPTNPT